MSQRSPSLICPGVELSPPVHRAVSSTELGDLETLCRTAMKEKQPFERLEVSRDTLLEMFKVRPWLEQTSVFLQSGPY